MQILKKNKKKFGSERGRGGRLTSGEGGVKTHKTLKISVLFATKTDVNAQNKAKSETGVHYNRAAKHGKKENRKNLQGVGVGARLSPENAKPPPSFQPATNLLPLRIFGVGMQSFKIGLFGAIRARVWYNIGRASVEGAQQTQRADIARI